MNESKRERERGGRNERGESEGEGERGKKGDSLSFLYFPFVIFHFKSLSPSPWSTWFYSTILHISISNCSRHSFLLTLYFFVGTDRDHDGRSQEVSGYHHPYSAYNSYTLLYLHTHIWKKTSNFFSSSFFSNYFFILFYTLGIVISVYLPELLSLSPSLR